MMRSRGYVATFEMEAPVAPLRPWPRALSKALTVEEERVSSWTM